MAKKSLYRLLGSYLVGAGERRALIVRALAAVGPLLRKAASGKFVLPVGGASEAAIAAAIASATGRPVAGIVSVSAADPLPLPDWIPDPTRAEIIGRAFGDSLDRGLDAILHERFQRDAERNFGLDAGFPRLLERTVRAVVGEALARAVDAGFGRIGGRQPPFRISDNLIAPIFYLLAFAVAGDAARVAELEPLVVILAAAVPLGQLRRRGDVWLALVA